MGSEILAVHLSTKVAVFWTCTSKMVTTSLNAYDDKHTRTKVMNLKGESDYFATFYFKARDSAPQNCLSSLKAEEVKQ